MGNDVFLAAVKEEYDSIESIEKQLQDDEFAFHKITETSSEIRWNTVHPFHVFLAEYSKEVSKDAASISPSVLCVLMTGCAMALTKENGLLSKVEDMEETKVHLGINTASDELLLDTIHKLSKLLKDHPSTKNFIYYLSY